MEELAIRCVVLLEDNGAVLQIFLIPDDVFVAALPHIGFEAIIYVLLCVSLKVHENGAVEVNHCSGDARFFIDLLEPLDRLLNFLRFDMGTADNLWASSFDNNLAREPSICHLIFDYDLVLARLNVARVDIYVVLRLCRTLRLLFVC